MGSRVFTISTTPPLTHYKLSIQRVFHVYCSYINTIKEIKQTGRCGTICVADSSEQQCCCTCNKLITGADTSAKMTVKDSFGKSIAVNLPTVVYLLP
jgi:hypothetical protein